MNDKNKLLKDLIVENNQKRKNRKNKIITEYFDISNLFEYNPDQKYCEICDIQIHRSSLAKHLKSKKHINKLSSNNEDQKDIVNKPSTSKTEIIKNSPKSLKELAKDQVKLDNKELAKKVLNPYYFKDTFFNNFFKNKFRFSSY